jgi:predicted HicB family RNase H-like nuclease
MTARVQIVARVPAELSRRVRAAAKRRKMSLNTFVIEALARAIEAIQPASQNREERG